jgi:hypothetical protein
MFRCFVGGTDENQENESDYPTFWQRTEAETSPLRRKSATNFIVTMYRYECHATGGNATFALHNPLSLNTNMDAVRISILAQNILTGTFLKNLSL